MADDAELGGKRSQVAQVRQSGDERTLALYAMNEEKDMEALAGYGGVEGLAKALGSSTVHGLDPTAVQQSIEIYGSNKHIEKEGKNFFMLCYETAQDPIIILLMVAALVSTVLGAAIPSQREQMGWVEGVAIWVAVIVVISVGAGNDWQKDKQFRKLNAQRDVFHVKVVRGGHQILVDNADIVVGDVLMLDTGDKICADGIVIESFGLVVDEASLTGEGEPVHKNTEQDPWTRSGTQVNDGSAKVLVVAVGPHSEWGKILASLGEDEEEQTPLQVKLEWVAAAVGKIGLAVAVLCFCVLLIQWCVKNNGFPIAEINNNGPVQFFLYGVTIVVVAVPEGLPLAVTISLAYSMKKMMVDNNFVRVLSACETMGGATAICSDKTGTLTENRMTVVTGWFCGKRHAEVPAFADMPPNVLHALKVNVAMTSKAFVTEDEAGKVVFVGNRTECALLMMLQKWNYDYKVLREEHKPSLFKLFGFSSERKMSCCVMHGVGHADDDSEGHGSTATSNGYTVYNKGAAEWVLRQCTKQYTENGTVIPLTPEQRAVIIEEHVTAMAKSGLRCIALTMAELPLTDQNRPDDFFEDAANVDQDLTLLAIVGIKDPVRPEVPDAVRVCQRAGIVVRMVTGDNIHTATHIARECGILPKDSNYTCVEGPDFRKMSEATMLEMLPNLRVLARSSPEDKKTLVKALKSLGEVVAVTGDGTNDAAALKASDVGLAMGIAGTEVAKEAADIIIMDDNFSSIVKSVLWGRSVFNNIRKFLQFQLTVNLVALVTAFIGAVIGGTEPLNVLQLLWVNMIMDSMGALALATEDPTPDLLLMRPHGREEPLINARMWTQIFTQGFYQLFWMFACLYALPVWIPALYGLNDKVKYVDTECVGRLTGVYNATSISNYCNWMSQCGFPYGNNINSAACFLWVNPWGPAGLTVPTDEFTAICGPQTAGCPAQVEFDAAFNNVSDGFNSQNDANRARSLSVLFNAFIWMQIANEIAARRIHDEYNFFEGIFNSPIFIAVILITAGLQAIIIEFLGLFFKTVPLNWQEWLACIAIGAGSWIVSLFTRWFCRTFHVFAKYDAKMGMKNNPVAEADVGGLCVQPSTSLRGSRIGPPAVET